MFDPELAVKAAPYLATAIGSSAVGGALVYKKMRGQVDRAEKRAYERERFAYKDADNHVLNALKKVAKLTVQLILEKEKSNRDELTGLPNLRAFNKAADRHFAHVRRHPKGEKGVLMILDLDNFKQVNDRYGHARGDQVLQQAATAMQHSLRREGDDMVARIGGEEFAVIAKDTSIEDAPELANRIREGIKAFTGGESVSIGIVGFVPGESVEQIKGWADSAMYFAKTHGKDMAVLWNDSIPIKSSSKAFA